MSKKRELERISERLESNMTSYCNLDTASENVIELLEESLKILTRGTKNEQPINNLISQCKVYLSQNYVINRTPKQYENEFEKYFYEVLGRPKLYLKENIKHVENIMYYDYVHNKRIEKLKQEDDTLFKFTHFGKKWLRMSMPQNFQCYED